MNMIYMFFIKNYTKEDHNNVVFPLKYFYINNQKH